MKSIVTVLVDPSGAADYGPDAYVEIWSQLPVGAGGTIATDKPLRVPVTAAGLSTPPIRAGNYLIRMKLSANRTALGPYPFTMPDGDGNTELWPLIAAGINIPAATPVQKIQEALAAYLIANPIDGGGLTVEQIAAAASNPATPLGQTLAESYAPIGSTGATTVDALTDATTIGKAVAKAADAPAARNAIGAASRATVVINADDYGVARDGVTDDTAALDAAFAAVEAAATSASVLGGTAVLILRAGRYIDSKARTFSTRVVIRGEGPLNTILFRKAGATGDYLTFNNQYSGLEGVSVDGNRVNCPSAGDNIVLNAYRTYVRRCHVRNGRGNGITIGKAAGALGVHLDFLGIGQCNGYGLLVAAGFASTDGMFANLDIGQCGLSGIRLSTGAQNLSLVHSWGNGLESTTDNHGCLIDSPGNVLVAYQGESNMGTGITVTGSTNHGTQIDAPKLWGNRENGLHIDGAPKGTVNGGGIYRNACGNTGAALTDKYAGIWNSGTEWAFNAVNVWDDTSDIGAGSYTSNSGNPGNNGYTPTYPFPGRASGVRYQSYAYYESTGAEQNAFAGVVMRKENTLAQIAFLVVAIFNRMPSSVNNFGAGSTPTRSVSSGVIRFPPEADTVYVSTTQAITSVTGGFPGRRCTMIFSGLTPGSITHSSALQLAGAVDWTPPRWATLTLVYDGTNWFEVSRTSPTAAAAAVAAVYDSFYTHTAGPNARVTGASLQTPLRFSRAVKLTQITARGRTENASGDTVIQVQRNGATSDMPLITVPTGQMVAGFTVTGEWTMAVGDKLSFNATAVGTTPGSGLVFDLLGVAV